MVGGEEDESDPGVAADNTARTFVAGAAAGSSAHDGPSGASKEAAKGVDPTFRCAVMSEAFAEVGAALAGCGEALIEDTKVARETLTSWMELSPLLRVSGGGAALVGELIVAAIVTLLVRNAAKIQEALMNDEEAASKYEQDSWWGNFESEKESMRSEEMDEWTAAKKSQAAKKVMYVKVLKDSLVKDIVGKRSFVYEPQADPYRAYFEQETQPIEANNVGVKGTQKSAAVEPPPRVEAKIPSREKLVLDFPVLSSSEQFRTNHMLDFSSIHFEAVKKSKDPFAKDILEKKKIRGSSVCC